MKNNVVCVDYNYSDTYMNLAYEECLLDFAKKESNDDEATIAVATWQNENSIIIGRNQSAAEECNLQETAADNVTIARRITGGGAVYHDLGNLNFTFVVPRRHYRENTGQIIIEALKMLGVETVSAGRNDIMVNGSKFSGNAYFSNESVILHHGTILISSDLTKMGRYLTPNKIKHKRQTTSSTVAAVANISSLYPDITVERMKKSIFEAFHDYVGSLEGYAVETTERFVPDKHALEEKYNKFKSALWLWKTPIDPPFCEDCFEWGRVAIFFHVNNGIIEACDIATDSLCLDIWNTIKNLLSETKFDKVSILERLSEIECSEIDSEWRQILQDIKTMISGAKI
ncbi:MAG: lipoate--protein ligase [Lachnospiraceae bacterium]|jgi:lipoate-protein ligase A|nr:lipoate--protein ligase [Lachnospiraceae bacterium]